MTHNYEPNVKVFTKNFFMTSSMMSKNLKNFPVANQRQNFFVTCQIAMQLKRASRCRFSSTMPSTPLPNWRNLSTNSLKATTTSGPRSETVMQSNGF